jgi:hypothetical protein
MDEKTIEDDLDNFNDIECFGILMNCLSEKEFSINITFRENGAYEVTGSMNVSQAMMAVSGLCSIFLEKRSKEANAAVMDVCERAFRGAIEHAINSYHENINANKKLL